MYFPSLAIDKGLMGEGCSHGNLDVSTSIATTRLKLDPETCWQAQPCPASRCLEVDRITSQELGFPAGY